MKEGKNKQDERDATRRSERDRFPESAHTKDQRQDKAASDKVDNDLSDLAEDVSNNAGGRNSRLSSNDRAGVSDLDSDMRRSEDV